MGTLRDDMEAAAGVIEAAPEAPPVDVAPVEAAPVDATPEPVTQEPDATEAPRAGNRDASGKFTKATPQKEPADATEAPRAVEPTKTEAPKPGDESGTRAPSSWRNSAREKWGALPPEIRKEVWRVDQEVQRVMQTSAEARRTADEFRRVLEPAAEHLKARGVSAPALVSAYVDFDKALSSGDQGTKAAAVARVMQAYGVDVEALASALDGGAQRQQRQIDPEQMRRQLREEVLAETRAERERHELASHVQKVQEFAKSADAELFNDEIRHDMAALIDSAAARGVALTLEEAYSRAVRANPETRAIVEQREAAKRAATAQAATQRAQAAGSSIKNRPASPNGGGGGSQSLRADMEAVAAQLSGR